MSKELKTHFSVSELFEFNLEIFQGKTERTIANTVKRQNWQFREVPCKGGRGGLKKEYLPPPEIQQAILQAQAQAALHHATGAVAVLVDDLGAGIGAHPNLPAEYERNLSGSTEAQRQREGARRGVLQSIEQMMTETQGKVGKDEAITSFLVAAQHPNNPHFARLLRLANDKRGGGNDWPCKRTIHRWFAQRDAGQLLPKVPQRNMQMPDWFALFLNCYRQWQKPSVEQAYKRFLPILAQQMPQLKEEPSIHQVRRWLDKTGRVEVERGRRSNKDLDNIKPFVRRDFNNIPPAAVYCADGHTFDAEVLNPLSGKPFRPEITTVIDVGTRRMMGWSVGLAESRFTVLEALCDASKTAIGAVWYVDWGRGFENMMMTDEAVGLLGRLGMRMEHSRAYNAKAKGVIERSHQMFTQAAKDFASYVGKDMDMEARKVMFWLTRNEMKLHGKIIHSPIPTWDEFRAFVEKTIADYNASPHRSLPKKLSDDGKMRHMSPNEYWDYSLEMYEKIDKRTDLIRKVQPEDENWLFRPQEIRTVSRGEISLFSNVYFSRELEEWHGEQVRVAYDVHNAQWVWIYNVDGVFVCKAEWYGNSKAFFAQSVIEQAIDERGFAAIKRLDAKKDKALGEMAGKNVLLLEAKRQNSLNLGGRVVDIQDLHTQAEVAMARMQPAPDIGQLSKPTNTSERNLVGSESQPTDNGGFTVPDTREARFALCQALQVQAALSQAQSNWVARYGNTAECRYMQKMQGGDVMYG